MQKSIAYFANYKAMKYYLTLALFISLTAISCKKNVLEAVVDNSSYYLPIDTGYSWIYQMDSVVYYGTGASQDSFTYQVEHKVTDKFINAYGNTAFKIEVSAKMSPSSAWKFARTYSVSVSDVEIIKSDFDFQELIMSKPFALGKTWDGNLYNSDPESEFYIDKLHAPASYGAYQFDSTITIMQEEQINLVNSFKGLECYAKNTGLIYKEKERLSNLTDPAKITGYTYSMTLLSFDK